MIDEVYDAFLEEYQIQKVLRFGNNEIDGFSGFVFSTGEGNVYTPESVNRAIVASTFFMSSFEAYFLYKALWEWIES